VAAERSLAAVLLLAAAGAAGTAGTAARADTPKPDRAAAPLCAAARATLAMTSFTEDHRGNFRASGTWQASGGATGVALEYRIDSDRYGAESQRGSAGKWVYVDSFPECDFHTARIHVFPLVVVAGRDVICLDQDQSVAGNFESACLPTAEIVGCDWRCEAGPPAVCAGTCTGRASGDPGGYVPFWGVDDRSYEAGQGDDRAGPWHQRITCSPGQQVSFKVRGRAGTGGFSAVVEVPCGQAK